MIGIDDVFEARIASRRQRLVGAAEESVFASASSIDGLDHQVGGDEVVDRLDAREHLGRVGRRPSRRAASRLFSIVASAALDRARERIVERDLPARGREDLGDAAAHLARADDEDVLEVHGAIVDQSARVTGVHRVVVATAALAPA